ncbi:MAG: hypothetical protein ACC656_03370, partial [Candidatus Heimdallarchaeota archaeon]
MQEAALFAGNAEKSLDTFQGKIAIFQTTLLANKRELGKIIADPITDMILLVSNFFNELSDRQSLSVQVLKSFTENLSKTLEFVLNLTSQITRNVTGLNEALNTISLGFLNIGDALKSPVLQMGLFFVLLKKVGSYFIGLSEKFRLGALTRSLEFQRSTLLRQAILSKDRTILPTATQKLPLRIDRARIFGTKAKFARGELLKMAQQQSIIEGKIGLAIKNKTTQMVIEKEIALKLVALDKVRANNSLAQLEYEVLINATRRAGLTILKNEKNRTIGRQTSPAGAFFVKPAGTEPKAGQKLISQADLGEGVRGRLTPIGRMSFDFKEVIKEIKTAKLNMRAFFAQIKAGTAASQLQIIGLKQTFKTIGLALKSFGAVVLNSFTQIFFLVTMIQIAFGLLKDLFKDNTRENLVRVRSIERETGALVSLIARSKQVEKSLEIREKLLKSSSNQNYLKLTNKLGISFKDSSLELKKYQIELIGINAKLKEMRIELDNGGNINKDVFQVLEEEAEF